MKKLLPVLLLALSFIAHAEFTPINLKLILKNNSEQSKAISFAIPDGTSLLSCLKFPEDSQDFTLNAGEEKDVQFTFSTSQDCATTPVDMFSYTLSTVGGAETTFSYNIQRVQNEFDPSKTEYSVIIANETFPIDPTVNLDSVKCFSFDGTTTSQEVSCDYPNDPFKTTNPQEITTKLDLSTN